MLREQSLTLNLAPRPAQRPRVVRRQGKSITHYSKPYQTFKDNASLLLSRMKGIEKYEGSLSVSVRFYMPIPKSLSKNKRKELNGKVCRVGGDIDNLLKSVYDALNFIAYEDDKQIVSTDASKVYRYEPRIEVTLREIEEEKEPK